MPKLGETFYTDPTALKDLVDPDALMVPGNFYVTEALNFIDERGVDENGEALDDWQSYPLGSLAIHPMLQDTTGVFKTRKHSLYVAQGDMRTQGAAGINVVGELDKLKDPELSPFGPLVRVHAACGYSEVGQYITSRIYRDPTWLYSHTAKPYDDDEALLPSFVQYGDGLIMGYPFTDNIEKSLDCDCRPQRKLAQFIIAAAGGISISASGNPQEGRGLGVEAKRRIYREQDFYGLNTVEACDKLGLPYEKRNYDHIGEFLRDELGLDRIQLLTNNPAKIEALSKYVVVTQLGLLPAWLTPEARKYVLTKGKLLKHNLRHRAEFTFVGGEMLIRHVPAHMDNPEIFASSIRIINSYAIHYGLVTEYDDYPVI